MKERVTFEKQFISFVPEIIDQRLIACVKFMFDCVTFFVTVLLQVVM